MERLVSILITLVLATSFQFVDRQTLPVRSPDFPAFPTRVSDYIAVVPKKGHRFQRETQSLICLTFHRPSVATRLNAHRETVEANKEKGPELVVS